MICWWPSRTGGAIKLMWSLWPGGSWEGWEYDQRKHTSNAFISLNLKTSAPQHLQVCVGSLPVTPPHPLHIPPNASAPPTPLHLTTSAPPSPLHLPTYAAPHLCTFQNLCTFKHLYIFYNSTIFNIPAPTSTSTAQKTIFRTHLKH